MCLCHARYRPIAGRRDGSRSDLRLDASEDRLGGSDQALWRVVGVDYRAITDARAPDTNIDTHVANVRCRGSAKGREQKTRPSVKMAF